MEGEHGDDTDGGRWQRGPSTPASEDGGRATDAERKKVGERGKKKMRKITAVEFLDAMTYKFE